MATAAAARSVFRSSSSSSFRSATSRFATAPKPSPSPSPSPSPFRSVNNKPLSSRLFRSPLQLSACLETVQPFHTVTASALLTSMLSVSRCGYGWLQVVSDDV